jgi:hypothetical protein
MKITVVGYVKIEDSYIIEKKLNKENKGKYYLGMHWVGNLHRIEANEILDRKLLLKDLEAETEYNVVFMTTNNAILDLIGGYIEEGKINQEDVVIYYSANDKIVVGGFDKDGYIEKPLPYGFFVGGL